MPPPPSPAVLQANGRQAAPPPPPERGVVDTVRNPNFNSLMQNQDYFNMLSQLVADRQARGEMPNLMPIGDRTQATGNQDFINVRQPGSYYTADMVNYIDPATGEKESRPRGIVPAPGSRFVPVERFQTPNQPTATTGSAMPQVNPQLEQAMLAAAEQQRNLANQVLINGQNATPNPIIADQARPRPVEVQPKFQIPQMQNYNQMLQQGMRRNQEMNQAAQNLAAPAGPAKSFSQVAGRTRRTPMPRPPANNSLAPSNRRLI